MHEPTQFKLKANAKGWLMADIAERWGITVRQMSNVSREPKKIHWDALAGLPKKKPKASR